MSNQIQIPLIHCKDGNLTQTQTNTNKVVSNLNNQIVALQNSVNQLTILGEIKLSPLTLAQVQNEAGNTLILANGQSVVDTEYAKLTGINVDPNITISGTNAFIKVNNG